MRCVRKNLFNMRCVRKDLFLDLSYLLCINDIVKTPTLRLFLC